MIPFVHSFLSTLLCGIREGYSAQHALLNFEESCKKLLDSEGVAIAVKMDFSRAFYCLNHELLISKLDAYGFSRSALLSSIAIFMTGRRGLRLIVLLVHGQIPS